MAIWHLLEAVVIAFICGPIHFVVAIIWQYLQTRRIECVRSKVTKVPNKERSLWPGTNYTLLELPSKVCYRYSILMQSGGLGVPGEVTSGHPCWCTLGLIIYAGCILVLVSLVHPLQIWYQPHPPSLISWGKLFAVALGGRCCGILCCAHDAQQMGFVLL